MRKVLGCKVAENSTAVQHISLSKIQLGITKGGMIIYLFIYYVLFIFHRDSQVS